MHHTVVKPLFRDSIILVKLEYFFIGILGGSPSSPTIEVLLPVSNIPLQILHLHPHRLVHRVVPCSFLHSLNVQHSDSTKVHGGLDREPELDCNEKWLLQNFHNERLGHQETCWRRVGLAIPLFVILLLLLEDPSWWIVFLRRFIVYSTILLYISTCTVVASWS